MNCNSSSYSEKQHWGGAFVWAVMIVIAVVMAYGIYNANWVAPTRRVEFSGVVSYSYTEWHSIGVMRTRIYFNDGGTVALYGEHTFAEGKPLRLIVSPDLINGLYVIREIHR